MKDSLYNFWANVRERYERPDNVLLMLSKERFSTSRTLTERSLSAEMRVMWYYNVKQGEW